MGKTAFLLVSAFVLTGIAHLSGAHRGKAGTEQQLVRHQYEVVARNAALAGYQYVRQRLTDDFFGAADTSGTYEGAAYHVDVARAGNVSTVTSTGTVALGDGTTARYQVVAKVERQAVQKVASAPPPFMQYALLTEGDLNLNGDILTDLYVRGDAGNTLNANVHTNGNLHIRGNSVEVRGFGTYVGTGSANPSHALTGSFRPYYNPTGATSSGRAMRVEIPAYDYALFQSRLPVVHRETEGDVMLSGTHALGGSRDSVYVWHVKGNLTSTGNVTLSGYVLFLVDGNVTLSGSVRAGATGHTGADESSIGIVARGNVNLGGNAVVYGQVYAGGDLAFMHGTPRIYGTLTTLGRADLRGTPDIYYRPASPALTTIFQEPEFRYRLLSYSEW